jgi:hypothetical protein
MTYHGCVRVMCIRFLLQDVDHFETSQLSDISNRLSHGCQHVVNGCRIRMVELNFTLL